VSNRRTFGKEIAMMTRRMALLAFAALAVSAALRAGAAPLAAAPQNVGLVDFQFVPETIFVKLGDAVSWKNNGMFAHTVTAADGSFDSGNLDPGQSFLQTFGQAGVFLYYCKYHGTKTGQGMHGTVVVVDTFVYMPIALKS
jgi:plastocyanin